MIGYIILKRSLTGSLTRFHVVLVSIAVCLDFVFRLFDRNVCFTGFSARKDYLKSNFMSMPCDSMRQKLSWIFSVLSTFPFTLFTFHVVSRTASNGLQLKFHFIPAF